MKAALQTLCEQFIENRDTVKRAFKWESDYVHPLCANLFCAQGRMADEETLKRCKQIVNEQTGILSNFRGSLRPALAAMLALGDQPDERMARAVTNYGILKQEFWGSEYLALVAFLLAEWADRSQVEDKTGRGKTIYQRMKREHPFLTSSEDSVFAVMMAFSDKTDDALITDMEACYTLLKPRFFSGNSVQTASHVLAMADGAPEKKAERVLALYDAVRGAGVKYGREYQLATLAALAAMNVDLNAVAQEISEADAFLSGQKGYGAILGPGKAMRAMHAAMIVSDQYPPRGQVDTAAMTGTLGMIIAQQMAMCAVMAGATAGAAAAHSST